MSTTLLCRSLTNCWKISQILPSLKWLTIKTKTSLWTWHEGSYRRRRSWKTYPSSHFASQKHLLKFWLITPQFSRNLNSLPWLQKSSSTMTFIRYRLFLPTDCQVLTSRACLQSLLTPKFTFRGRRLSIKRSTCQNKSIWPVRLMQTSCQAPSLI